MVSELHSEGENYAGEISESRGSELKGHRGKKHHGEVLEEGHVITRLEQNREIYCRDILERGLKFVVEGIVEFTF